MPLSDIVNVQITRQTQSVTEPGFGSLMILGASKNFNDLIRKYSNIQGVSQDFNSWDPEFIAAQEFFSQPITPPYLYIGRRTVDTVTVDVETAMPGNLYTIDINGSPQQVPSTTSVNDSVVTLSGVVTTTITFSGDFGSDNTISTKINGAFLTPPVPYHTSQAQTLNDICTQILTLGSVISSCTNDGSAVVTVVFASSSSAVVDSVTVAGTAPPTAVLATTGPLVTGNLINVSVNGTIVGTITSVLTFSADFTAGTSTVVTVNGVPLAAVLFTSDNPTTLTAITNKILTLSPGTVSTATNDGSHTITVVFTNPGNNTINSAVTTGGSAPTAIISEGGFYFSTDTQTTMNNISAAILAQAGTTVTDADISGTNFGIMSLESKPNTNGVVNFFTVKLGSQQATAAIVNSLQPTSKETIANALYALIHANSVALGVDAVDNMNGSLTITAIVPGVPYTISVKTNVINPNAAQVMITQAIPDQSYTIVISGYPYTYTADVEVENNEEISAGLVALINSPTYVNRNNQTIANPIYNLISATDNGNGTLEIDAVSTPYVDDGFSISVNPLEAMNIQFGLIIGPYVPSALVATDLTNIQDVNNDWYALACTDRTVATVQAIAAWVEPQIKLFGTSSADPNIINQPAGAGGDLTSIAYLLFNSGYARSFVLYHQDAATDYPECAWFGNCLPLNPGSETWAFKMLNSIAYSELTTNQENNAFSKNCNTYEFIAGVGITRNGTVAAGEYIDIIRGIDWLTSTIQVYVYSILISNPKVPYTNAGITAVESQIRRALNLAIANNFIASEPPYMIIVPNAVNVPAIDKANRILNGVSFQATLAGAIQVVNITGTVSV